MVQESPIASWTGAALNPRLALSTGLPWAAQGQKHSYYPARFHQLKSRRGPQMEICAVAASIVTAVDHLLNNGPSHQRSN